MRATAESRPILPQAYVCTMHLSWKQRIRWPRSAAAAVVCSIGKVMLVGMSIRGGMAGAKPVPSRGTGGEGRPRKAACAGTRGDSGRTAPERDAGRPGSACVEREACTPASRA